MRRAIVGLFGSGFHDVALASNRCDAAESVDERREIPDVGRTFEG